MIAPDPDLLRRLRRTARRAIKSNPRLRREWKQRRTSWNRKQYNWSSARFLVPLVILIFTASTSAPGLVGAFVAAWSMAVTFSRSAEIVAGFASPELLWPVYHLPVSDDVVAASHRRQVFRSSLWLAADWLAFGLTFAVVQSSPLLAVASLGLAGVQWAVGLAAAITLVRWMPGLPYRWFAGGVGFALFLLTRLTENKANFGELIDRLLGGVGFLTPAGWVHLVFAAITRGEGWGWIGLVGLGVSAMVLIRSGVPRLREFLNLDRAFGYDVEGESAVPGWTSGQPAEARDEDAIEEPQMTPVLAPPASIDRDAMAARLGELLSAPAGLTLFQRSSLNRAITRALTERQRLLVDFLQPRGVLNWSRSWCIALGLIVAAKLFHWAQLPPATAFTALLVAALLGLPLLSSGWRGFDPVLSETSRVGFNSYVPVGFWETSRLLLRIAMLRSWAGFPLVFLAMRFGLQPEPLPWFDTFTLSLRVLVVVWAVQPIWVIAAFSSTTNDTSARFWFTALMLTGLSLCLLAAGLVSVLLFAVTDLGSMALASAVVLGFSHGALLAYGWSYNRGIFDAMAMPRA